jgi:hypothetical protein
LVAHIKTELRLRVFAYNVLRKWFGFKRDEVTGRWRRLRTEELYDLYSSPNINRFIKSRRMRGGGGVSCGKYRVLVGKPEENNHLEYLSLDGRIILKWIFKK